MHDLDTKNVELVKAQTAELQSIVGDLIDLKTGQPKPGTTKQQMLFALEQIRKIKAIYDERSNAHEALSREIEAARPEAAEVGALGRKINKKYGGKVYPKWFLDIFGK